MMKAQTKGWKDETMDADIFGQMLDENITFSSDANERANHLAVLPGLAMLLW